MNQTFYGILLQPNNNNNNYDDNYDDNNDDDNNNELLNGYAGFITDNTFIPNISLGTFDSNYTHTSGCFGLGTYYWSYYTYNLRNKSEMCTSLYTISPDEYSYLYGQYDNKTIALICLNQLDYPLLNIAQHQRHIYVSYMSPVEFKVHTITSLSIPEYLYDNNISILSTLFLAPDGSEEYLCIGNYPSFVVYNLYTSIQYNASLLSNNNNNNNYGCENQFISSSSSSSSSIQNYTFTYMFGSNNPMEINFIAYLSTVNEWFTGNLFIAILPESASIRCIITQPLDLPKSQQFLVADINTTSSLLLVLMSNGLYEVDLESGDAILLGYNGNTQDIQEIAAINYLPPN